MLDQQYKKIVSGKPFNAQLILENSISEDIIKNNLASIIAEKFNTPNTFPGLEASEVNLINYAYIEAKPEKWLINVEWEVK